MLGTAVIGGWVVVVVALFNVVLAQRLNNQAAVVLRTRVAAAAATVDVTGGRVRVRESYADHHVRLVAGRELDRVVIDVSDDGPGVPPELREAIFEPGRRGTVDDGHDGAGLGLALSRRLARAASGAVEVPADTACFRVRLPPG